jgi:hypothetical protein
MTDPVSDNPPITTRTATWIRDHQFLVYVVLGILAWAIVAWNYPLESLTPVYANF